jgi:DNA-3-methyladenine glycosylase II
MREEEIPMKQKPVLLRLKALQKRVEPFSQDIRLDRSLFEALASAICSQQLSLKAAATIFGRFKALFPKEIPTALHTLELPHAALRGVGLSEAKARAVRDLAEKTLSGVVPDDVVALGLTNEELIERLTQVRGIGKWTVEMILMFRYRRPDVWPVDDLGVQKGFRLLFPELKFRTAKELQPLGNFWAGKRSEIAWYCWRALEEEQNQTFTAIPVLWQKKKMQLWLKGEKPWRLDFTRTKTKPKTIWPGVIKVGKTQASLWQKRLEVALKKGPDASMLEISGTPFQQQVWAAIAAIPWGETRTYLEIAESVGNLKGVRAVAQACGANPLPLFIPCHRVVGTGNLGGFAGGLALKRLLLAAEKK